MKLDLLLPHLRTGGIESGLVRLAPELLARGFTVRFVLQSGDGELRDALPAQVNVVALNAGGMLATARAYASLLRKKPSDVVYSATNALNVSQLLAARLLGSKAPVAVIGEHIPLSVFLASRKRPWLRRALMRLLYPRASAIVAPTQNIIAEHQELIGTHCPSGTVLPNPVVQDVQHAPELSEQARYFVSLGRLSAEKGFDLALHMMAEYRAYDANARMTIYGEGPELPALEALRDSLGMGACVSFPGRTEDVGAALAEADLFFCTSHAEGFGNAIVEAQAAGVPVFSVDCPFGPRLLLQDGAAGCLVESRDAGVLADALSEFARNKSRRTAAQSAAQDVARVYTVAASADAHAAFFRGL